VEGVLGSPSAYIKATIHFDHHERSTESVYRLKTRKPSWDHNWILCNVPANSVLHVEVHHHGMMSKDVRIAVAPPFTITKEILEQPEFEVDLQLVHPKNSQKRAGRLQVHLYSMSSLAPPTASIFSNGVNVTRTHPSLRAGVLAASSSADSLLPVFNTYQVEMFHVTRIFGADNVGWNRQYKAAQRIYAEGPDGESVRAVIRSQHASLYNSRKAIVSACANGNEFLELFQFGVRAGRRRFYTWVLLDHVFRFCESGAGFFRDFLSKHAMHASCRPSVRYAGEFHIQPPASEGGKHDGDYHLLVLDNNSGTFAPPTSLLPKVEAVFRSNFPDLHVVALAFDNPLLTEYKSIGLS